MNGNFLLLYQYPLAWGLYFLSALVILSIWWSSTQGLRRLDLRAYLRGLALVGILTPWFATSAREHLAPAALVMVMDLTLGDAENGKWAALALLLAFIAMTLWTLLRRRQRSRQDWGGKTWR